MELDGGMGQLAWRFISIKVTYRQFGFPYNVGLTCTFLLMPKILCILIEKQIQPHSEFLKPLRYDLGYTPRSSEIQIVK